MAAPPVSEVVRIRDDNGGVLAVERAFTPGGYPLLVHSGSPGSRRLRPRQVERAAEAGFCLVSYDRPGYGDSSPHTGRVVANAADDVALIADALGYAELAVWGFSGGGPFALAAAAGLPQLVRRLLFDRLLGTLRAARPSVARSPGLPTAKPKSSCSSPTGPAPGRLFRSEAVEAMSRFSSPERVARPLGRRCGPGRSSRH